MKLKNILLCAMMSVAFGSSANITHKVENEPIPNIILDGKVDDICKDASIRTELNHDKAKELVTTNLKQALPLNTVPDKLDEVAEAFVNRDKGASETADHCLVNVRNKYWEMYPSEDK
ncbi:hypothetical protein [Enterobacter hormaechei]|uniref:hypothetical protein n=1 Tax=Enterobacter hormaechei TaxID=158836 RepID=UPI00389030BB